MGSFCADPASLSGPAWMLCYLTNPRHLAFYTSFGTVIALLLITAVVALSFGFGGAMAARARIAPVRWFGKAYIAIVRGVPDIAFFMFFVIALDQAFEIVRHHVKCPDWDQPIRQGSDFLVCAAAKLPLSTDPAWVHELYAFALAVLTFSIVFGAFAANILFGAMKSVPRGQIEAAESYGMSHGQIFWRITVPQMWLYALPGLSNLWMVLIKATPLLFLLGIQDVVYWARELGASRTPQFTSYPHGDWRMWYFLFLLVFYLTLTKISEIGFDRLQRRFSAGQATTGGEALRKAAA